MKLNKSIQKSWDRLESFFSSKQTHTSSTRPRNSLSRKSISKSFSRSPSKFHNFSISVYEIAGVSQHLLEQLYYAKCSDLQISAQKNHKRKFFEYCSTHFLEKNLKLIEYSLGPKSGKVIGEILIRSKNFSYLRLGKNFLGDEGVEGLLPGLSSCWVLVHLDLSNNNLTSDGAGKLLRALVGHSSLYSLNLGSCEALHKNKLGKACGAEIQRYLTLTEVIGVLNFYGTGIIECIPEISEGLENNKSLVSLNLGGNYLSPSHITTLIQSLKKTQLLLLDLSDNLISNEGCASIAEILALDFSLEQLFLHNNNISFKGCKSIFGALYSNYNLKKLDLSCNPLHYFPTDISYALENNTCLKDCNFSDCSLTKEAINYLGKILIKNKGLEVLNISSNSIEDLWLQVLCNSLEKNFILKSLNLSKNRIKNTGAKLLSEALKLNQSLIELNLKENAIKDSGGEDLCEATRLNHVILKLGLDLNFVGIKVLDNINKNLKTNAYTSLKSFPERARRQMATYEYSKKTLNEINKKVKQSVKEKEDIMSRLAKHSEKLDEAKQNEQRKYELLHENYMRLRDDNFHLSEDLESIEKKTIVTST